MCRFVRTLIYEVLFILQEKEKKDEDANEFVSAVAWRPVSILEWCALPHIKVTYLYDHLKGCTQKGYLNKEPDKTLSKSPL